MADKKTAELSFVLRAVDKATAVIKAVNARLDVLTKPIRDFKKALGELREKSGLDDVVEGFKGVGSAIAGILSKIALIGGAIAAAVAGVFHLIGQFDELGDKAELLGVSVDFLAQMRFAAERSGAEIGQLDSGLKAFTQSLGQARAGTGRMAAFLKQVSPALLRQVKAAKSNEEAFDLMARAMEKIKDPAKRAALAQKVFGDAALSSLLARGSAGIKALREEYFKTAGSQEEAAKAAGETDDALKGLHAATDGVKAALVTGLAPALTVIVKQIKEWLVGHRADVKEWAAQLGKRLPDAFHALVGAVKSVINFIRPFVDSATKLKIIAVALAAVIVGPLITSIVSLGIAILSTPIGWILAGITALVTAGIWLYKNWSKVANFFAMMWEAIKSAFSMAWNFIIGGIKGTFGAAADLVMAVWTPVKDFFVTLWGGITAVFQQAWDIIKGIVDKVKGAVDFIVDKVEAVGNFVTGGPAGGIGGFLAQSQQQKPGVDIVGQAVANLNAIRAQSTSARVTVDFANAPRGTRVKADPQSTADVDLNVGYNLLLGAM